MNLGYIYCFYNTSIPDIFIIGSTIQDVEIRLNELNISANNLLLTPYVIEIAKKVSNALVKWQTLQTLLERLTNRTDLDGEFYRISREEVHSFFDLMDGEIWTKPKSSSSYKRVSTVDLIDFTTIQEGSLVRIDGLLVNTNLNGTIGVVVRKIGNIEIYRIKMNDNETGTKFHLIRSENLIIVL